MKPTFAFGRQRPAKWMWLWKTNPRKLKNDNPMRSPRKMEDTFPVLCRLARALAIGFEWTTSFILIPRHAFNLMGHMVLPALLIPVRSDGAIRSGRASD